MEGISAGVVGNSVDNQGCQRNNPMIPVAITRKAGRISFLALMLMVISLDVIDVYLDFLDSIVGIPCSISPKTADNSSTA